ncbi:MAG: hypothetical protein D3904_12295 [Candidatus Electrothrix sp. EH2]|nr:hypothetical protein [Candidatus Electrothrix sp. EH2]
MIEAVCVVLLQETVVQEKTNSISCPCKGQAGTACRILSSRAQSRQEKAVRNRRLDSRGIMLTVRVYQKDFTCCI